MTQLTPEDVMMMMDTIIAQAAEIDLKADFIEKILNNLEARDQEIYDLASEIARLRLTLEWYADPILAYSITQTSEPRSAVHDDGGRRARAALEVKP